MKASCCEETCVDGIEYIIAHLEQAKMEERLKEDG